jgi:hypothetical protein
MIVLGIGMPVALLGGVLGIGHWVKHSRSGPVHAYQLQPIPRFLTDDVAVEKARHALALDGFDAFVWQPSKDDRTKAPDGTPDVYLVRNSLNPNDGWIMFRDTTRKDDPKATRIVTVELKGDRLDCVVVRPE